MSEQDIDPRDGEAVRKQQDAERHADRLVHNARTAGVDLDDSDDSDDKTEKKPARKKAAKRKAKK